MQKIIKSFFLVAILLLSTISFVPRVGAQQAPSVSSDLKISTDGVTFSDGPISFSYGDKLWFKWSSTMAYNLCNIPTPPESGGIVGTFMATNWGNYTFGPIAPGINGYPYSADALSITFQLQCNNGVYNGQTILVDSVVANFRGQNPVSTSLAAECTNMVVGTPTAGAPAPGYTWGPAYMTGNPRWKEIEWRIQNGIALLPADLGKYYTEYYTAMGLPQSLSGLLRSDGTPFAGPGGLSVPAGKSVTNGSLFQTYDISSGVFEYQSNMGFVGSTGGASSEVWFSPFSSSTRVACPLNTALTSTNTNTNTSNTTPTTNTNTTTNTSNNSGQSGTSTKFSKGSQVQAITKVNVRQTANGVLMGAVDAGAQGTVVDGPIYAGSFYWWKIQFSNYLGWSAENYLENYVPSNVLIIEGGSSGASGGSAVSSVTNTTTSSANVALLANGVNGPLSISLGTPVSLSWKVSNQTSCYKSSTPPSEFTGVLVPLSSGTVPVYPTSSIEYKITCGNFADSVVVNVGGTNYSSSASLSSGSTYLNVGDIISVNKLLNVRQGAALTAPVLSTESTGAQGTIVAGPGYGGGYTWWNVNFTNGKAGWIAQDFVTKTGSAPVSTPTTSVSSTTTGNAKFAVGDTVSTTTSLNVKSISNITATILATAPTGTKGTVWGGPVMVNGENWWNISFQNIAVGWGEEKYLTKIASGGLTTNFVVPGSNVTLPKVTPTNLPTCPAADVVDLSKNVENSTGQIVGPSGRIISPAVLFILPSGWTYNRNVVPNTVTVPGFGNFPVFPTLPILINYDYSVPTSTGCGGFMFTDNTVRNAYGIVMRDLKAEGAPPLFIDGGKTSNDVFRQVNGAPLNIGYENICEMAGVPAGMGCTNYLKAGGIILSLPSGCTSSSGFSATTGKACVMSSLPAGCTSPNGFSTTTGKACTAK